MCVSDVLKYICIRVKMCTSSEKTMLQLGNNQRGKMNIIIYILFLLLNQIPHCLSSCSRSRSLYSVRAIPVCVCVLFLYAFVVRVFAMAHISH